MKYQYLEKFKVQGIDLDIEILGLFSAGQQRTLQIKDNSYRVKMNGAEVDITETNLEILRKAGKVAKEVVIVDVTNEPKMEQPIVEKKRLGRLPKTI